MELPNDANYMEQEIFNYLVKGIFEPKTNANLYAELNDPIDKFILCYVFDLGRTQKEAQQALGLCKTTIWKRVKKIRVQLQNYSRKNKLLK